jgi:hypothetical protein
VCNVSSCPKFPLISYNHGAAGGDIGKFANNLHRPAHPHTQL